MLDIVHPCYTDMCKTPAPLQSCAPRHQEVDNLEDLDEAEVKCASEREAGRLRARAVGALGLLRASRIVRYAEGI